MAVVPATKALYLCDRYAASDRGKIDLLGLFTTIRPTNGYPYVARDLCAFVQLSNGWQTHILHIEIWEAATLEIVHRTGPLRVTFPDRTTLIHAAVRIPEVSFLHRGLYVAEMFCDNVSLCDTTVRFL